MAERKSPFDYGDDERPAKPGMAPKPPRGGSPFDYGTNPIDSEMYSPKDETLASKATDFLGAASNTFSMGMTPRIMGATRYLSGGAPSYSEGVNQELRDAAIRRARSPYTSLAGDVTGGAVQTAVPGLNAIGRTTSVALGGALPGVRGIAARMAGYGAEGGVLGAGQAAGHTYSGNPEDYAKNALMGGAFSAALGAPFGRIADVAPRSTAAIPTSQQLRGSASDRYTSTHSLPIEYPAPHFWRGVDALEQQLLSSTNPVKSPAVWESLRLARQGRGQMPPGSYNPTVTPKNIDELRQQLTGIKEPGSYQARQWLDNYMATAPMSRGTAADRTEAARILTAARGDYRAGKRTQTIEESNQYASDRAAVANSGQNVANTYGQKLTNLLSPTSREGRWYTPAEKADIRATARRDSVANAQRFLGNAMGGGGGMYGGGLGVGGLGLAYQSGDWLPAVAGVAIPATGYALKSSGNRSMVREADALAERMAMNSPLYREGAARAPVVAGPGLNNLAETSRNAITFQIVLDQLGKRGFLEGQETP